MKSIKEIINIDVKKFFIILTIIIIIEIVIKNREDFQPILLIKNFFICMILFDIIYFFK